MKVFALLGLVLLAAPEVHVGSEPWVSDLQDGRLTRLSPRGRVLARVELGGQSAGIAVANGVVFVADYGGGLTRVDAATRRVLGRTALRGHPEAVAVGFGARSGRCRCTASARLARIDPRTGTVTGVVKLRGQGSGVLADAGSVCVANYDLGTVSRIDASTLRIVRTYRVGIQPRGLAHAPAPCGS